jgi:hypothetical protein
MKLAALISSPGLGVKIILFIGVDGRGKVDVLFKNPLPVIIGGVVSMPDVYLLLTAILY